MNEKICDYCAYCGSRAETEDHIPPKSLFPNSKSKKLIRVPACKSCHTPWSSEDEYFRDVLVCEAYASEHPRAAAVTDRVVRAFSRSAQARYVRSFLQNIVEVEMETKNGIILGRWPILQFDENRINAVATRIVRGLFFREKDCPVPSGYEVTAHIDSPGKPLAPLEEVRNIVRPERLHKIENGIFTYQVKFILEDPSASYWHLVFYKAIECIGFIRPQRFRGGT